MSYKGAMDGWHGDEYECQGDCGVCESCEFVQDMKMDDDDDDWWDELF